MKLGKTKDSRTRKQPAPQQSIPVQYPKDPFISYLLKRGYSNTTAKGNYKAVERFKQWAAQQNVPLEEASYNDILHYIQSKKGTISQRTVASEVNNIKHYYNYLLQLGIITENPVIPVKIKGVKRKTLYHILSKQELESIYHHFEIPSEESRHSNQNWYQTSMLTAKRNKVIIGLIIYQGLTTSELAALTINDIKLREGKIYVAGNRKSNERTLTLEAHQILDMMEYTLQTRQQLLTRNPKQTDSLFISIGESVYFRNIIANLMKTLCKENTKITSLKQIRASVITHWLKHYNLRQVQYMAGHRYVSSTEQYLVNDLDDLSEEITKYHPIG